MHIPKVNLNLNRLDEERLFLNFLDNPKFPQHKNYIFNAFPELKKLIEDSSGDKAPIVSNFVSDFYKKNEECISTIEKKAKKTISTNLMKSLAYLADSMDYKWAKTHEGYIAKLTILPFSPFENNTFFYSILAEIRGADKGKLEFVAIHEISHFILFEILEKLYNSDVSGNRDKLDWMLVHFMKEILAPVLMNQEPLKSHLSVKDYVGNANLKDIYILDGDEQVQISKFFQRKYEYYKKENILKFKDFLEYMTIVLREISGSIKEKNEIWGHYGFKIYDNKEVLEVYKQPINIKNTPSE